jgi:hypothetical protein
MDPDPKDFQASGKKSLSFTLIKKKRKVSSYIRKFRRDRLQRHIVRHTGIQEFPNLNRCSKVGTYNGIVNYSRADKFTRTKSVLANLGE